MCVCEFIAILIISIIVIHDNDNIYNVHVPIHI